MDEFSLGALCTIPPSPGLHVSSEKSAKSLLGLHSPVMTLFSLALSRFSLIVERLTIMRLSEISLGISEVPVPGWPYRSPDLGGFPPFSPSLLLPGPPR